MPGLCGQSLPLSWRQPEHPLSAILFKASFHQCFQALKGHISTPRGGGAQPSLPGSAAASLAAFPLPTPPPLEALTPDHPMQGADSNRNHLGQNTPKRKRDESSRPHAGHPRGWGTLLCVKGGVRCRAGGRQRGQPRAAFASCGTIKTRQWQQKGPNAFPPTLQDPRWQWWQSELLVFAGAGGFRAPVPAAKAGLAGGGHMAGSSMRFAIPAADRQQPAEPLLRKGGRAKRRLWHRGQPAARYAQVLQEA